MKSLNSTSRRRINITILVTLVAGLIAFGLLKKFYISLDTNNTLIQDQSFRLDIRELSALAPLSTNDDPLQFAALGDSDAILKTFSLSKDKLTEVSTFNFRQLLLDRFALCPDTKYQSLCTHLNKALASDWEGLAITPDSTMFMLQEHSGAIVILKKDSNIPTIINLDFNGIVNSKAKRKKGNKQDDKLAEGIILLKNGHILVSKESKPTAMIEFAPNKDESAMGFSGKTMLADDENFDFRNSKEGDRVTYYPIFSWHFGSKTKCDLSEITKKLKTAELFAISQKCNLVYQFEELSAKQSIIAARNSWKIPEGVKGAESLLVLSNGQIFIGSDQKKPNKPNLFQLHTN